MRPFMLFTVLAACLTQCFSLDPASIHVDCGPNVTYPIAGYPIADYDANCNVVMLDQNTTVYWFPRNVSLSQYDLTAIPESIMNSAANLTFGGVRPDWDTFQPTPKLLYSLKYDYRPLSSLRVQNSGSTPAGSITLPIDIRASVRPRLSVEMMISTQFPFSRTQVLFSADSQATATGSNDHSRSLIISDTRAGPPQSTTPCGLYYQPWKAAVNTDCRLPSVVQGTSTNIGLYGYTHVVVTFSEPDAQATVYINGIFSQVFNGVTTVDSLSTLIIGGVQGTTNYNIGATYELVYTRVWDRVLNQADVMALSGDNTHYAMYNYPIVFQEYPYSLFVPLGRATAEAYTNSRIGSAIITLYRQDMDSVNKSLVFVKESQRSLQTDFYTYFGNQTWTSVFAHNRMASDLYLKYWNFSYANMTYGHVNTSMMVFANITSLSADIQPYSPNLVMNLPGKLVTVAWNVTFNRPVKQAMSMPFNQTVQRGQGFEFVDSLAPTTQTGNNIKVSLYNESWTMVSTDRTQFVWSFQVIAARYTSYLGPSLPLFPVWPLMDDYNVISSSGNNRLWYNWASIRVTTPLVANITSGDMVALNNGTNQVHFLLSWNYQIYDFDVDRDIVIPDGCSVVNVTTKTFGREFVYWIQTPVLYVGQTFNLTLAINPNLPTTDQSDGQITVQASLGVYGPMVGTVAVSGSLVPSSTAQAEVSSSSSSSSYLSSSLSSSADSSSVSSSSVDLSSSAVSSSSSSLASSSSAISSSSSQDIPSSSIDVTFGSSSSATSSSSLSSEVSSSSPSSSSVPVSSSSVVYSTSSLSSSGVPSSSSSVTSTPISSSSSLHAASSSSSPLQSSSSSITSSQHTSSSSSQPVISLSSVLQPRDRCAEYYSEDYLGASIDDYVASLPPGSTRINFVLTGATLPLPRNFDVTFGSDIALNIAFMLEYDEQDAEAITAFIDVTSVGGCVSGSANSRRLLYVSNGDLTLSAFILGNVSDAIPGFNDRLSAVLNDTSYASVSSKLGVALEHRLAAGTFVTPASAVNLTGAEITPAELIFSSTGVSGDVADDASASSYEWTDGRIAGVVIGCVLGFMLILVASICAVRHSRRSDKAPSKSKTEMPIYWTGVQSVMPAVDDQHRSEFKY